MDVSGWLSTNRDWKQMSCSCTPLDSLSIPKMSTYLFLGLKVVHVGQEIFEDTMCSPLTGHTWPRSWLSTNTTPSWLTFQVFFQDTLGARNSYWKFCWHSASKVLLFWTLNLCPSLLVTVISHKHRAENGEVKVDINQQINQQRLDSFQ